MADAHGGSALSPVVRSVLSLAAECGRMTRPELDEVIGTTLEGQSRKSLERLSKVAAWASKLLLAESARRP
jgi:hypothetical protein